MIRESSQSWLLYCVLDSTLWPLSFTTMFLLSTNHSHEHNLLKFFSHFKKEKNTRKLSSLQIPVQLPPISMLPFRVKLLEEHYSLGPLELVAIVVLLLKQLTVSSIRRVSEVPPYPTTPLSTWSSISYLQLLSLQFKLEEKKTQKPYRFQLEIRKNMSYFSKAASFPWGEYGENINHSGDYYIPLREIKITCLLYFFFSSLYCRTHAETFRGKVKIQSSLSSITRIVPISHQ